MWYILRQEKADLMPHSLTRDEEKAELEAVLASGTFARAQNLARLLRYLCTRYFEGRASDLKEYNIGVEALGRPPGFDPASNSIVRVELHRLREKLKRHYEVDGQNDPVVIVLEPGNYAPRFIARADVAAFDAEGKSSVSEKMDLGDRLEQSDLANYSGPRKASPGQASPPVAARGRTWGRALRPLLMLALAGIVGAVIAWKYGLIRSHAAANHPPPVSEKSSVVTGESSEDVRILAGYSKRNYVDRAGRIWGPDRYYSGGVPFARGPLTIDRTTDPTIFQNGRLGDFSYDIPLKPGVYELRLYFAETVYGPNSLAGGGESSRIFNVEMNGKRILDEFDPLADAGASNTADERVFDDVTPAPDGRLHLHFSKFQGPTPPQDEAIVNAIEILPDVRRKMRPVRIVAQNNSYTDHSGQVWSPDAYASQGRLVEHNKQVEGTSDPGLFYGERFGHFSYAIPVATGKYAVTLYFAETYFGPENPGRSGAGSRLFDLYCNGREILHNFDILKEAGGANRALAKTFRDLVPNPQGKLILTFVPVKNYACINAIQVTSEE